MYKYNATIRLKTILTHSNLLDNYTSEVKNQIIKDNCAAMEDLMARGCAPTAFFEYVGDGAFKEAYELIGASDVIIKFCSASNYTSREEEILYYAEEDEVDELFIPTYFGDLDYELPAAYVEDEDSRYIEVERQDDNGEWYWTETYNEDYAESTLNAFEVQPRCIVAAGSKKTPMRYYDKSDFEPITFGDFTIDNFDTYCKMYSINIMEWWEAVFNLYGSDLVNRFLAFQGKYQICDLHWNNVGFYVKNGVEYPIILDWLSN